MLVELWTTLLLGLLVVACVRRFLKVRLIEKIPGPPSLPLLGNAIDLMGTHRELFEALNRFCGFGKGMSRIYLGLQPYCLLYRANTVEVLLSSSSIIDKSSDYDFLHPWLGTGLLTSRGAKWRSRRKLLTPAFHFKILDDFVEVFNHQSQRFVSKLDMLADGRKFNIFPMATLCTLDIIMEAAMGTDINIQNNSESSYVKAVYGIAELVQIRQANPWLHYSLGFKLSGYEKRQQQYLDVLHSTSLQAIKQRREEYRQAKQTKQQQEKEEEEIIGKKKRLAFLDLLLEASETSTVALTDEDLREEVDTFMFEGHDTTAAAVSFALYFIARHSEIQARVFEELMNVVGDSSSISQDQLRQLRLLECCVKEALRLCPSVPFLGRRLFKDVTIDGYFIPAGTQLLAMIYTLHRDPQQFPDPLKFNPDRFLPDAIAARHPYAYVPFSAGPRNCIGQRFALMEEKLVLASVLRKFHVTATQDFEELSLLGELILRPEKGIMVTLTRRD